MHKNTSARRVTHHWTASPIGTSPAAIEKYMADNAGLRTGYTLLMPLSKKQRPVQLRPANYAAGSLYYDRNFLPRSPNREGSCHLQVGWICTSGDDPFVKGPGEWYEELCDWMINVLGIPEQYVYKNWSSNHVMPKSHWLSNASGHTAHKQVNERGYIRKPDPGPVLDQVIFGSDGSTPPPKPPPSTPGQFTLDFDGGKTMSLRYLSRKDPMMRGGDCQSLQGTLNQKGYNAGSEDGIFGDKTRSAVKRAQQALGIQADGIVGPVTMERLWEK
jgi:hypothetical protein